MNKMSSEEIMGLADANKERMKKIKEKRLEQIDKTTEQDRKHSKEGSVMANEPLPEYPFKEGGQTKKKPAEPAKTLPWE